MLVGDPGTGKTAVVEGLALRIAAGDVPESLRKCRLLSLDLTALVVGQLPAADLERRDAADFGNRRGGLSGNLNRGKQSLVLNLADPRGL